MINLWEISMTLLLREWEKSIRSGQVVIQNYLTVPSDD